MAERNQIQRRLIEEFCRIRAMEDEIKRNICAAEWIEKYADNFDRLDTDSIEKFKASEENPEEREKILKEIQKRLEELDRIYG